MSILFTAMNSSRSAPLDIGRIVGAVFAVPADSLKDTDSPETIPTWDSFQTLIMFQEIERAAGVSFTLEDIKQVRTVGDLKKLLHRYRVPLL